MTGPEEAWEAEVWHLGVKRPPWRPSWDETWMRVADAVSLRSRCDSRQVGAVIVDSSNRVVSSGYNGPPSGYQRPAGQSCSSWCPRRQSGSQPQSYGLSCPSVHAEANALIFADRATYQGGTIYVTASCCADCAKLVANSGVTRVVVRVDERDSHRDPEAVLAFMRECGLDVLVWSDTVDTPPGGDATEGSK